jgi:hypothetical protein
MLNSNCSLNSMDCGSCHRLTIVTKYEFRGYSFSRLLEMINKIVKFKLGDV